MKPNEQGFILCPKNLYRALTQRDLLIMTNGCFPASSLKGMTLGRFWSDILSSILPPEQLVLLLDLNGRRNRMQGMFMNRTGSGLPRSV